MQAYRARVTAIRRWLRADGRRSIRIDYFTSAAPAYRWAAVGMHSCERCIVSACAGRTLAAALAKFGRTVEAAAGRKRAGERAAGSHNRPLDRSGV